MNKKKENVILPMFFYEISSTRHVQPDSWLSKGKLKELVSTNPP